MARKRSYLSKAGRENPAGVLLNNTIAGMQKKSRENKKNSESSARAAQRSSDARHRALEKENDRISRAAVKRLNQIQKDEKLDQQKTEKMEAAISKLCARATIEFERLDIPISKKVINNVADRAYESGVTPGQISKTLIEPNIQEHAKESVADLLGWSNFLSAFFSEEKFQVLIKSFCKELPVDVDAVKKSDEWIEFVSDYNKKVEAHKKYVSRLLLLREIAERNDIFTQDSVKLFETATELDFSAQEMEESEMYLTFRQSKVDYKKEIAVRLAKFEA